MSLCITSVSLRTDGNRLDWWSYVSVIGTTQQMVTHSGFTAQIPDFTVYSAWASELLWNSSRPTPLTKHTRVNMRPEARWSNLICHTHTGTCQKWKRAPRREVKSNIEMQKFTVIHKSHYFEETNKQWIINHYISWRNVPHTLSVLYHGCVFM